MLSYIWEVLMSKFFHMNSLFTKIILAVLSFAVIVCIFIPYTQIPAIKAVQDVDVKNRTLAINVGKEAETVNIISKFGNGQPFIVYKDKELTETVNMESIPIPQATNVYYFVTYAYGYDAASDERKIDYVPLNTYTLTIHKEPKNDVVTTLSRNNAEKTIDVTVANISHFKLSNVIDSRKAWARYPNGIAGMMENRDKDQEVTSIKIDKGSTENMYVAISLRDPATETYFPLDMYTLTIKRDAKRQTLPTVGEVGMGVLSSKLTKENDGVLTLYTGDAIMFTFMILAAVSTLFALIIPAKFKLVELFVGSLLGAALIVFPILDYVMFFSSNAFYTEAGWIILMVLGALIILASVFDYIRCRSEYREEQIRIYGDAAFTKKPKAPKEPKKKKAEAEQ